MTINKRYLVFELNINGVHNAQDFRTFKEARNYFNEMKIYFRNMTKQEFVNVPSETDLVILKEAIDMELLEEDDFIPKILSFENEYFFVK